MESDWWQLKLEKEQANSTKQPDGKHSAYESRKKLLQDSPTGAYNITEATGFEDLGPVYDPYLVEDLNGLVWDVDVFAKAYVYNIITDQKSKIAEGHSFIPNEEDLKT